MYGPCSTGWATSPWRPRCAIWRQQRMFTTKWTWLRFRLSARPNRRSENPQCARPVPLGRRTRDDRVTRCQGSVPAVPLQPGRDQADFKSRRTLGADALAERVRSGWVLGWADLTFVVRSIRKALRPRAWSAFPTSAEILDLLVDTGGRLRYGRGRNLGRREICSMPALLRTESSSPVGMVSWRAGWSSRAAERTAADACPAVSAVFQRFILIQESASAWPLETIEIDASYPS